jgi:hypothetical protein
MRASRVITLWMLTFSTRPSHGILFLTTLPQKRVMASLLYRLARGSTLLGLIAGESLLWRTPGARAVVVALTEFCCTFACAAAPSGLRGSYASAVAPTNSCRVVTGAGTPWNLVAFLYRHRVGILSRSFALAMLSSPASTPKVHLRAREWILLDNSCTWVMDRARRSPTKLVNAAPRSQGATCFLAFL